MQRPAESRMYIVTAGFGTTVAMWSGAYVCRLPAVLAPGWMLLGLLLACLFAGGVIVGRHAGAGPGAGALVATISSALNLLILGSFLANSPERGFVPSALVWGPGSLFVGAALGAAGAAIGRLRPGPRLDGDAWRSGYVLVAAAATLLVVVAGGLVTSLEAGLAVPDWPNSFRSNMFLYPLSRMTGGIYFEHAHRLYGSLVGLTTIVLAIVLWRTDDRRWMRWLGTIVVLMVVVQGVIGGLRVTGSFTLATDRAELAPSVGLAVVHGVFGQMVLATIVLLWAFTTRAWRDAGSAGPVAGGAAERSLTLALAATLLVQLAFGAMFRHLATDETPLPWPGAAHLTLAAIVAVLAAVVGLRACVLSGGRPMLRPLGVALLVVLALQLVLGVAALVPVLARREDWRVAEVLLATAHQANGAVLLAIAVQLVAWTRVGEATERRSDEATEGWRDGDPGQRPSPVSG